MAESGRACSNRRFDLFAAGSEEPATSHAQRSNRLGHSIEVYRGEHCVNEETESASGGSFRAVDADLFDHDLR